MDSEGTLKKGDIVFVLDYPFGRPLNVKGVVVGVLRNDFYNIRITHGMRTGDIAKYKYWNLSLDKNLVDSDKKK